MHLPLKRHHTDFRLQAEAQLKAMRDFAGSHNPRLRRVFVFALACAIAIVGVVGTPDSSTGGVVSQSTSGGFINCVSPDADFVEFIDTTITSTDSITGISMRATANLPFGPVSSVSAITDPTVCHQAAVASGLSQDVPDSLAFSNVSVLRVGATRYVVTPIRPNVGEFQIHLTFDTLFTQPPVSIWAR